MKTTIDAAGRVVVPKAIRERLQWVGRADVEIEERDGIVEIRPLSGDVRIVQTPEGPVAVCGQPATLSDETVRATLERVRG